MDKLLQQKTKMHQMAIQNRKRPHKITLTLSQLLSITKH
jgi:hypothetical protein